MVKLQFLMMHDHLAWHFQLIPSSYPSHQTPTADNQIHLHSCVGTSRTVEGAHETAATSATFVNAVEGPIQNSAVHSALSIRVSAPHYDHSFSNGNYAITQTKLLLSCFYLIFDKAVTLVTPDPSLHT